MCHSTYVLVTSHESIEKNILMMPYFTPSFQYVRVLQAVERFGH
jgi:hypothetical protein